MENRQEIRDFVISYIKRYIYEMKFFIQLVKRNELAFDSAKDTIEQFNRIIKEMDALLDYTFLDEEVEKVKTAGIDTSKD